MTTIRSTLRKSLIATSARMLSAAWNKATRASFFVEACSRLRHAMAMAHETSTLQEWTRAISRVIRHSFCYRWLTSEPDPEIIVIDLRDTYTVEPVISLVDRIISILAPGVRHSFFRRGCTKVAQYFAKVSETRPGRVIRAIFEPPEPPEGDIDKCE